MLGVNHDRRSATSDHILSIDSKNVVSSQGLRVRHTLQKCRTLSQAASFGPAVSARQLTVRTRLHDLVVQALRRYVVFAMTDLVVVVRPDCYRVRCPGRAFQRRIGGCEDSPWIVLP